MSGATTFSYCQIVSAKDDTKALPAVIVDLKPSVIIDMFALEHGCPITYRFKSDPSTVVLGTADIPEAIRLQARMAGDPRVSRCALDQCLQLSLRGFYPDDPYFPKGAPRSADDGQWHLFNTQNNALDANLVGAWQRDLTGDGVTIGIVDEGLEVSHEDLADNVTGADSWDFVDGDSDPSPELAEESHGTAVAGVAAARGGNTIGVTGAAPRGTIAGLRVVFGESETTLSRLADAIAYRSSGFECFIAIKNYSFGFPRGYVRDNWMRAAVGVSYQAGTIQVCSSGNERNSPSTLTDADSNKKALQALPEVITVAALGSDGTYASYSNFGANVFCTAPSSSFKLGAKKGITTTDRTGSEGYNVAGSIDLPNTGYTNAFGGTSAAAPLVSGILALAKQANPNLDSRLAKHLLVRSCDIVDPNDRSYSSDGGWRSNAAGFKFNQNYGFGLVDASELTTLAQQYCGVTQLRTWGRYANTSDYLLPDNKSDGLSFGFSCTEALPLEEVIVDLNKLDHPRADDIEVTVTSPSGTTSRLLSVGDGDSQSFDGSDLSGWSCSSNAFWGEKASGAWTVKIADRRSGSVGRMDSVVLSCRMGAPVRGPIRPMFVHLSLTEMYSIGSVTNNYVHLNACAPKGGAVVTLSDDSSVISFPKESINVAYRTQDSESFVFETLAVSSIVVRRIFATHNGYTVATPLTLRPPWRITSLTLTPSSIEGGQPTIGKIEMNGPAIYGPQTLTTYSNSSAVLTGSARFNQGSSEAEFAVDTNPVASNATRTIFVFDHNGAKTAVSIFLLATSHLAGLSLSPQSVKSGQPVVATVRLAKPAALGGAWVSLSDNSDSIVSPASVFVAAGQLTATTSLQTNRVSVAATRTVYAERFGRKYWANLNLLP